MIKSGSFFLSLLVVFLLGGAASASLPPAVSGLVTDLASGAPLAGAVVTCGEASTRTGADGRFRFAAADGTLRVRAVGYRRFIGVAGPDMQVSLEPFTPKALYLSFYGVGSTVLRKPIMNLLQQTELNALVIDFKGDRGMLSCHVPIPLAAKIGAQRIITIPHPRRLLATLRKKGVYTIARIVVFKDNLLAQAHPELAIRQRDGKVWRDGMGLAWVDPFRRRVWDYNLQIAEQAAQLGFDEIQFDYVRFPDAPGLTFARPNSLQNRIDAITGFLTAARNRLRPYNVFLSADIFGYVCWNTDDTHIGQQLEQLTAPLDYISPMLYPSGFSHGVGRYRNPVANPAKVVLLSLNRARQRTGLSPLRFRPWLQAFTDYAFDGRHFAKAQIRAQTRASDQFGTDGWMLWNARNVYHLQYLEHKEVEARADLEPTLVVQ